MLAKVIMFGHRLCSLKAQLCCSLVVLDKIGVQAQDAVGWQRDGAGYDAQLGYALFDWCRRIEG
eukprot:6173321-Pleurochrysis_carterae.AAC.1